MRHILIYILIILFTWGNLCPNAVKAGEIVLPVPGTMVHLSSSLNPPILKGIKVHPDNPFRFEFVLSQGDKKSTVGADRDPPFLKDESTKLIKYFLAALTTPEKDMWVNLSPYEKDRIVPESFGQTAMGRDLLAQDYLLKQITASLVYPEGDIGKQFWKRVYEISGNKNVPVNTFNKVWIVPNTAVVYENTKAGTAYVVEASLKVMTEQDYLANDLNRRRPGDMMLTPQGEASCPQAGCQANKRSTSQAPQGNPQTQTQTSQIIKDIVIPQLTKEVNVGANFAQLRQVYNSLILAAWYKKKIKDSILSKVYADRNKVKGTEYQDTTDAKAIYERYLQAFKKGAYNYIKEEQDPVNQQLIPRKYFSGGVGMRAAELDTAMITVHKLSDIQGSLFQDFKKGIRLVNLRVQLTKWGEVVKENFIKAGLATVPVVHYLGVPSRGLSLLPESYKSDIQSILSMCDPKDLEGLKITIMPAWHPMALIPMFKATHGFQYSNGIVLVASFNRQDFRRLFLHELTHWIVRNKPYVKMAMSSDIFDNGKVVDGAKIPGYLSGTNDDEYVAELVVYAALNPNNDGVILERQRELINRNIINLNGLKLQEVKKKSVEVSSSSILVGSVFVHAVALSIMAHTPYSTPLLAYGLFAAIVSLVSAFGSKLEQVTVNTKARVIVDAMKKQIKYGLWIGSLSLMTIGMAAYSIPETLMQFKKVHKQGPVANNKTYLNILKQREYEVLTVRILGVDSDKKPRDGYNYVDSNKLGRVPVINDLPEQGAGLLNPIASIYTYFGRPWTPEQIAQNWGEYNQLNKLSAVSENNVQRLPSKIVSMLAKEIKDGAVIDGFVVKRLPEVYPGDTPNILEGALRKGHPVLRVKRDRFFPNEANTDPRFDGTESTALIIEISRTEGTSDYYYKNNKKYRIMSVQPFKMPYTRKDVSLPSEKIPSGGFVFYEIYPLKPKDKAMANNPRLSEKVRNNVDKLTIDKDLGGIDLNTISRELRTDSKGGQIVFDLDPAMLKKLQQIPGFTPNIISYAPIEDIYGYLSNTF